MVSSYALRWADSTKLISATHAPFPQRNRSQVYGLFASDVIRKSMIEFCSICVVENEYEGKIIPATTAPDFPYYLQHKTGIAEAYSLFAFPKPLYPEETFMLVYLTIIPDLKRYFQPCQRSVVVLQGVCCRQRDVQLHYQLCQGE
ncbi:hypothetical protein BDV06DRAFT_226692 [Aspergillus oleicola]